MKPDSRKPSLFSVTPLSQVNDHEAKQRLRVRRFFMAVITYGACGLLAQVCAWLGYLPGWLPMAWAASAVVVNVGFYIAFRRGWNLRLRDPSMTEAQLVIAMFAVMVLTYYADATRGAFLMLFPVLLLFGVLRLRLHQMARIGAVGIVGYTLVIMLLLRYGPERVHLDVELINLLTLTSVMVFVSLMGGYLSKVRAELAHSVAKIRDMAQRDSLTGLFNRRHLMETLERELQRCERKMSSGVALCMIDLDHFKRINDTFGHPAGDEVLILAGNSISASIRNVDYVARYGGEEFVVLLDGDSCSHAHQVCERIRADVARLEVAAIGQLTLSASMGVARYKEGDTVASLLARADKALYQAKADGRNCVRVAP